MTSRKIQPGTSVCRAALIFLLTIAPNISSGQANASVPAPLPPAAQEALNKGIVAAKVPDYLLAIRFFEEARKLAPEAPVIYLNLGLAESRIPGRELRAMAWFGAYLAAYPGAPNAAAVKEKIAELDVKNQSNISRLIKSLQDAASLIQDAEYRGMAQSALAEAQTKSGDIAGAQKATDLIQVASGKCDALIDIAEAKSKAGDLAGAQETLVAAVKTADRIDAEPEFGITSRAYRKSEKQLCIAEVQATNGDIAGALKTADLIKNELYKSQAQAAIAEAQAKSGDTAGAQNTFVEAQRTADLLDAYNKGSAQEFIASAQAEAGYIAGAQKTADLIQGADYKSRALSAIAEAQIRAGDIAGAQNTLTSTQKTTDLIQGESYGKSWAQSALAEAQARSGDIASAGKTADLVQDADLKRRAQRTIAEAQAKTDINQYAKLNSLVNVRHSTHNPARYISDWLKILDDVNESNDCPLSTGPFVDLDGHLKSHKPSDNDSSENYPYKVFKSLHDTAEKIVDAQNIIHQMLKQQARR